MISIITGTYNAARTLADNLDSVSGQTVPVEHLLIDGVSSDATLQVARTRGDHLAKVVSEPDCGIYDAMNKGISLATGEVVGILNADDVYAGPDVLARVARVFEDPRVEACYGDLVYVREVGLEDGVGQGMERAGDDRFRIVRYWKSSPFDPQRFYWGWMPPHPTFFVRRSVYERFGTFNLELGTAADYELMLRLLLKHRIRVEYLPEVLVRMRVGGASNASVSARIKANRNDRRAWEVNGLHPWPWTLWCKPLRKIPQWWLRPMG